jgi:hypothetical protein
MRRTHAGAGWLRRAAGDGGGEGVAGEPDKGHHRLAPINNREAMLNNLIRFLDLPFAIRKTVEQGSLHILIRLRRLTLFLHRHFHDAQLQ